MSFEEFSDNCPGCRPVLLDIKTGQVLPDNNPMMVAALGVWSRTTREERQAFHRVACLNSRDPKDLTISTRIANRIAQVIQSFDHDLN